MYNESFYPKLSNAIHKVKKISENRISIIYKNSLNNNYIFGCQNGYFDELKAFYIKSGGLEINRKFTLDINTKKVWRLINGKIYD